MDTPDIAPPPFPEDTQDITPSSQEEVAALQEPTYELGGDSDLTDVEKNVMRMAHDRAKALFLEPYVAAEATAKTVELTKRNEELNDIAMKDPLTGLYTRRVLQSAYDGIQRSNSEYDRRQGNTDEAHLLMMDLDGFKSINDTYGHPAGDELLKRVADILRNNVRDRDIPARFAGDEFVALLARAPKERVREIAETIRREVSEQTSITVSIGVGEILEGKSLMDTMHAADAALYAAKRDGKNVIVEFDQISPDDPIRN